MISCAETAYGISPAISGVAPRHYARCRNENEKLGLKTKGQRAHRTAAWMDSESGSAIGYSVCSMVPFSPHCIHLLLKAMLHYTTALEKKWDDMASPLLHARRAAPSLLADGRQAPQSHTGLPSPHLTENVAFFYELCAASYNGTLCCDISARRRLS